MDPVAGAYRFLRPADLLAVLDNRLIDSQIGEGDLMAKCDILLRADLDHVRIGHHADLFAGLDIRKDHGNVVAGIDF